jgi:Glucodextranase, domain B
MLMANRRATAKRNALCSHGIARAGLVVVVMALGGCGSSATKTTAGGGAVALNVTSPSSGTVVSADNVTVRGTVAPGNASVQIQGQAASVGNGVFVGNASIHNGTNTIDIIASAHGYTPASTTITLTSQATTGAAPTSGSSSSPQSTGGANASPGDLELASPPDGAYNILVPANWSYHSEPSPSGETTDLWVGSNPQEKLQVTVSNCAGCATSADGGPDARGVGLPAGTVSSFDINPSAVGYQANTSGNAYADNGIIVVTSQDSAPTGYAEVDLWLPDSLHSTATRILDSFSLLQAVQ